MERAKGILYAALSSSTFSWRRSSHCYCSAWATLRSRCCPTVGGVASLFLGALALLAGRSFRLSWPELRTVFFLSLFRAATSLSLVIAYQHIASGVASTIHFMYPLAVALAMMCFFREKRLRMGLCGHRHVHRRRRAPFAGQRRFHPGNTTLGMVSAAVSVVSYGGYIVGVRKSRAVGIDSTVLTCYVMGLGALYFIAGGLVTGGIRIETDGTAWLCILGVALPATAVSNMTLVQAIKRIGPTLTSVFGALEPLTAVVIGVAVFGEPFTVQGAAGILLIVAAVTIVILHSGRRKA